MAGSLSNAANANNLPSAPIAPTTRQPRNDVAGAAGQGRTRVKPAGPFIPRASPEAAMEPEEKVHGATMVRPVEWGREPFDASMGRVGRVRGRYY